MIIRWQPIPGYPGYEASNHGRIRGPSGTLLVPQLDRGRQRVTVKPKSRRPPNAGKRPHVHALVALAFLGPRPEGPAGEHVRHLDGNRLNNRPENLAYGTYLQNNRDPYWNWRFLD